MFQNVLCTVFCQFYKKYLVYNNINNIIWKYSPDGNYDGTYLVCKLKSDWVKKPSSKGVNSWHPLYGILKGNGCLSDHCLEIQGNNKHIFGYIIFSITKYNQYSRYWYVEPILINNTLKHFGIHYFSIKNTISSQYIGKLNQY